jgi:hypothetical protein
MQPHVLKLTINGVYLFDRRMFRVYRLYLLLKEWMEGRRRNSDSITFSCEFWSSFGQEYFSPAVKDKFIL